MGNAFYLDDFIFEKIHKGIGKIKVLDTCINRDYIRQDRDGQGRLRYTVNKIPKLEQK